MEELFANIMLVLTIVALVSSIVGIIFGLISIKTDNVFIDACFNIFIGIGAASLALITISFFF